MIRLRLARRLVPAVAAAMLLASCAAGAGDVLSAEIPDPGNAGDILEVFELDNVASMRAWRIRYQSANFAGEPVAMTALLAVPDAAAPEGGWPLAVWSHGTTGLADECAPSLLGVEALAGLDAYAQAGWALVYPDFEGLGTDAGHPYLVAASEGHAVLDAARAAIAYDEIEIVDGAATAIVGSSQGGHAALSAAALADAYAPELNVVGVAVGAPVTDVGAFADYAAGEPLLAAFVIAIAAGLQSAGVEVPLEEVLDQDTIDHIGEVEGNCISGLLEAMGGAREGRVVAGPTSSPAWADAMTANRPDPAGLGTLPALVLHGEEDPLVPIDQTEAWVDEACGAGATVELQTVPGAGLDLSGVDDRFITWIGERLAGTPAGSTC